jgi:hypothetical protein
MAASAFKTPHPLVEGLADKTQKQVYRDFQEVEKFLGPLGTPTPTGGLLRDMTTGAFTFNSPVTFAGGTTVTGTGTQGITFTDRSVNTDTWQLYATGATRFKFWNNLAASEVIDIDVNGNMTGGPASFNCWRVGNYGGSAGNDPTYAQFSHETQNTANSYAVAQQNNGETFLNSASGRQLHLRINNADKAWVDASGAFRGVALGGFGTFLEHRSGPALIGTGTFPNFVCMSFTTVISVSGSNGNISWPQAFGGAIYSVVGSNGDQAGSAGGPWGLAAFTNYSNTGCGVTYVNTQNATFITGNIRLNIFVTGS